MKVRFSVVIIFLVAFPSPFLTTLWELAHFCLWFDSDYPHSPVAQGRWHFIWQLKRSGIAWQQLCLFFWPGGDLDKLLIHCLLSRKIWDSFMHGDKYKGYLLVQYLRIGDFFYLKQSFPPSRANKGSNPLIILFIRATVLKAHVMSCLELPIRWHWCWYLFSLIGSLADLVYFPNFTFACGKLAMFKL